MDEQHPGWYEWVDTARLDMSSCTACVIGQALGGGPGSWTNEFSRLDDLYGLLDGGVFASQDYRDAWIAEIEARRNP